jgi:DNA-binding Lrp family transcriptional regulator
MDELDRRLLNEVQRQVPLVREPFAQLAMQLGCDEGPILRRIEALRHGEAVIREISGIFDAVALGYQQALVAMRVPPERLDEAGQAVARHPGVSHCYARDGDVNLWLTLAVSPASRLGLAGTARRLARLCGAGQAMLLPTLRRYKLQVRFDMDDAAPADPEGAGHDAGTAARAESPAAGPAGHSARPPAQLSDEQVRAIRALQVDLPARSDPFAPLAAAQGLEADMLLVHAADFIAAGWMRRYAAVLYHRAAGSTHNVLVAWMVPDAAADAAGARCAELDDVSHCYLRPAAPGWPYTLYTMIHGRSRQDCRMTIDEIVTTTGMLAHAELWTVREYKKQRMKLFAEAEKEWEEDTTNIEC